MPPYIPECMKSELDLFARPPIQSSILKIEEVSYKPISSIDKLPSVLEFVCLGNGEALKELSSIYLRLQIQLFKDTNDVAHDTTKCGVVNNILHSLFRQCTIYLNGKPIAQTDTNYHYRAYIENLLNYGSDAASTHLESVGWILDNGDMESLEEKKNLGLDIRKLMIGKSGVVELMGKVHGDMLNQSRLLLNNVDLRIVFSLEKPEFYVMEADIDTSYVKILSATLYMNHVTVNPNVLLAQETVLQKTPALYPYKRVEVKSYTVPANNYTLSLDNVVIGQLPNLLIFAMVDNDAYSGKRSLNPFNFKHNNLAQINLTVNGVQVPSEPLQMNYSKEPYISTRAYNTLFKATGIHYFDKGHQITKKFYDNGCFLLAFDLTADHSNNNAAACTGLLNSGTVRIEGRFREGLKKTITCIVYTEFDAVIEIDRDRNVHTTF